MYSQPLQQRIQTYLHDGYTDEYTVATALMNKYGGMVYKSTQTDDIQKHIDLWWLTPQNSWVSLDVKGWNNKNVDVNHHWIEIQNVGGYKGWLLGDADYIAFLSRKDCIFVPTIDLMKFTLCHIIGKPIVNYKPNDFFMPYQRAGRKDIIYKISHFTLKQLSKFTIDL